MPVLQNPRHEAFARARAKGALLEDAYEDAGLIPGHGHASRLALRPEVVERVAELRAAQTELEGADIQGVITALLRISKASETLGTPAGLKESRETLLVAARLRSTMASERRTERRQNAFSTIYMKSNNGL